MALKKLLHRRVQSETVPGSSSTGATAGSNGTAAAAAAAGANGLAAVISPKLRFKHRLSAGSAAEAAEADSSSVVLGGDADCSNSLEEYNQHNGQHENSAGASHVMMLTAPPPPPALAVGSTNSNTNTSTSSVSRGVPLTAHHLALTAAERGDHLAPTPHQLLSHHSRQHSQSDYARHAPAGDAVAAAAVEHTGSFAGSSRSRDQYAPAAHELQQHHAVAGIYDAANGTAPGVMATAGTGTLGLLPP
eukprot:10751-Heterococcus_DN1.PRE.1